MVPRNAPFAALLLILISGLSTPDALPAQTAPAIESINQADLRADLFFLAGDEMRGRLAGSAENRMASAFIKSRFERLGLQPVGSNGSYYQYFNVVQTSVGDDSRLGVTFDRGVSLERERGQEFYPLRESDSGTAAGELVFAGFGITSADLDYDDYGSEVAGKIVLIVAHEPGENDESSPFDGLVTSESSANYEKLAAAQEAGAIGVLMVTDVHNHPTPGNFSGEAANYWPETLRRGGRYTLASRLDRVRIPAVRISPALAESLVAGTGRTLEELSQSAESSTGASPVQVPGVHLEVSTDVRRDVFTARNVVGLIEGSDPVLKDEWIIISAHFDHDGAEGGVIYNGADDDGFGTVGVMEIAEGVRRSRSAGRGTTALCPAGSMEFRGKRPPWGLGVCRRPTTSPRSDLRPSQHGHDRPERGGCRRGRQPLQGPGHSIGGVQRQRHQHPRHDSQRRPPRGGARSESGGGSGAAPSLRQPPDSASASE